jgi:hypothetical protein
LLEEVECLGREFPYVFLIESVQVVDLREAHAEEAWVFAEGFLMVWSQFSQGLLDEIELVELILSREERISVDQLSHDAPGRPEIHFSSIGHSHEQFRRTVPPGGHVISEFLVSLGRLPCEAKVADLQLLAVTDQQVLGLDVAVQQVVGVHVRQSLQ